MHWAWLGAVTWQCSSSALSTLSQTGPRQKAVLPMDFHPSRTGRVGGGASGKADSPGWGGDGWSLLGTERRCGGGAGSQVDGRAQEGSIYLREHHSLGGQLPSSQGLRRSQAGQGWQTPAVASKSIKCQRQPAWWSCKNGDCWGQEREPWQISG